MTIRRGLIVLEGGDDVGKTTLAHSLVRLFEGEGIPVSYFSFPGKEEGTLGRYVYDLHHEVKSAGTSCLSLASLQALHIAAHLDVIERKLNPLLAKGVTVVLDRYWWSTLVYGQADGVDSSVLLPLIAAEKALWHRLPDHAFLIERPGGSDGGAKQGLRERYRRLAENESGDYPISIIQNSGTKDETLQQIWTKIESV